MGVKGLWQLLESVGRPVTLESLENKVLGVDASLLLNQSVKGMRDKHGNPVPNAHLVGLFNRVCKLLYYRIKPVFVFDGGVPHLKKKTLAARKEQRFKAIHKSNRAAEKIVKNYLKAKALETVTKRKSTTTTVRSRSPREPDVFELPPLPSSSATDIKSSPEDEDLGAPILEQFRSQHLEETFQDPSEVNIDSEDFKALPPEIQHELIKEVQAERKWMNKNNFYVSKQATDFSSFQLQGVLKRGKMNQRLEELYKEMNQRHSGELAGIASEDSIGENSAVKSQKILSEDSSHYILIKRNESQEADKQEMEACSKDFSNEGGFFREGQDCEIISWANPPPKPSSTPKAPSFDIPELCSSDSENPSPFLDVAEACLSPTSPQVKKGSFSFSPVKIKNSLLNALVGKDDDEKEESQEQMSHLGSKHEGEKCDHKDSQVEKLRGRSNLEMEVILTKDSDEDGDLLTQIKDKKKELDDLIKKWKNSKTLKTVIDLTANGNDGSNIDETKELPLDRSEIVEVTGTLERQQKCTNIKETENMQRALVIDDETEGQEKVVDAVCISESESEASSVQDVTAFVEREDGVVDDRESNVSYNSMQEVETPMSTDAINDVVEDKTNAVSSGALHEIETIPTENAAINVVKDKESPVSPDILGETQSTLLTDATIEADEEDLHHPGTQKDAHLHVKARDNEEISVVEKQDSSGEGRIEMDVDVPVAGPSGLPVEWQGATVEELEDIRMDLESEQKSLASEQARQNRIAATVSNEMFAECQELLQLFGVPYLVSPMEAEAQCAMLDVLELTQGSITDDSDIFLFGGRRVYKNIFNQNKHVEMFESDAVQRNLALDRSRLICIAFLTGSDYTEGIQGVGAVGAMEILHEFTGDGLEGLKKFKLWHAEVQKRTKHPQETKVKRKMRSVVLPADFPSEEVFEAYLHPVVDESTELFEWGKPDLHSLRLYASEKLGWASSRTDEILLPVLKQLNKNEAQMKIDQYFQVKFQEKRKVKSKRIQRVLNRTFNPSSSSSDSEDGGENNKKDQKHSDEISGETTKIKRFQDKRKSHSTETSIGEEEDQIGVNRVKRAKGENDQVGACPPTVNRSRGRYRGRGRGRGKARKSSGATPNLEAPVEQTSEKSSCQQTSKQTSLENQGDSISKCSNQRTLRTRARSSTPANNRVEAEVDNVNTNNLKTRRTQRNTSVSRGEKERMDISEEETSTSDSTDSDENDEEFYVGPKPVSVFRRGRGRGRGKGNGRGRGRGK